MEAIINAIILSLLPIAELRGGIPLALASGVNPVTAYFVCVIANIFVIPLVFIFLGTLHRIFMIIPIYKRTFEKFLERTRKKVRKKIEKYGYIGLTLFVTIPLPITGAYTGTLAAWFFGMKKLKSFLAISLGVVIAGLIVTAAYLTGAQALSWVL